MVAREDDDCVFPQAQLIERIENASHLSVHVGNAGVIGFEQSFVQFRGDSVAGIGFVFADDFRHVFEITFREDRGNHCVAVVDVEVFLWSNQGHVRPDETTTEEERFVLVALEEFDRCLGRHPVGVFEIAR